jgi:rhodanese-related sulfurtransferase
MGPFPLNDIVGQFGTYIIFLLIGAGFGAALELSGFARSTKLTAQFYLRDMTVFKVMFSAVLVAMILVFGAVSLGLLDYDRIWVPPTYLVPGTLGGLLLGIGFIIGGFCPGTSLAGLATLKKDALFFIIGILGGIVLFGETLSYFSHFWESTYMGRFTLDELLGLPMGVTVFLVAVVGVLALWGAELIERTMRKKDGLEVKKIDRWVSISAGALILAGFVIMLIGQPTAAQLWERVAPEKQALLDNREVQIHPAELRDLYYNKLVNLVMLDVRDEADYNLFHIKDAERVPLDQIEGMATDLKAAPDGTVVVLMSNDETGATEAWKTLVAKEVPNVYLLEGGINNFIGTCCEVPFEPIPGGDEMLRYNITAALGANHPTSTLREHGKDIEYTPKVKLQKKAPTGGGGCG